MLKVYRYDALARIRCDAIIGKELVINVGTYIYNGNSYWNGDINKGTFNASSCMDSRKEIKWLFCNKGC